MLYIEIHDMLFKIHTLCTLLDFKIYVLNREEAHTIPTVEIIADSRKMYLINKLKGIQENVSGKFNLSYSYFDDLVLCNNYRFQ